MEIKKFIPKFEHSSVIRRLLIKTKISNIGEITEEKDRFICYAKQKTLDKKFKTKSHYELTLHEMTTNYLETQKFAQRYKFDKPVYYIFENIDFKDSVDIHTGLFATHIIFKNCKFRHNITIICANEITFENNEYYDRFFHHQGVSYLYNNTGMIHKLIFVNDNFINHSIHHHPTKFGMDLELDTLEIINTKIDTDNSIKVENKVEVPNRGGLSIKANQINIVNSSINVAEFYLDSDSILIDDNSKISASEGMIIENKNNDLEISSPNISTPYLVYNGLELTETQERGRDINKDIIELQRKRAKLLSTWKSVANKGVDEIKETLGRVEKNLYTNQMKKILKRHKRTVHKN